MADSNSNSSGSSTSAEHSGSGQSTKKPSRRDKVVVTDSPALNSSSSSLTSKLIAKTKKEGRGHGSNIYNLVDCDVDCDVDRETAARAVAMVVRAANKRGYVSLCTEFATLLRDKERLEMQMKLNLLAQKRKRTTASNQQCVSCSSSESGSGGSGSSTTRGTQTKPITLLDSSASSVGSLSKPTLCADACVSTDECINLIDKGFSPTGKNSTVEEELKKAKEHVSKLEHQLYAVKAENQALKTQLRHSQKSSVCHLGLTESQGHNKVVKGSKLQKDIKSPEPISPQASPTLKGTIKKEKAQSFSSNLMKDQNPNHDQNCSLKSCVKHRIRNGFGQATPSKVYPMPSSETPLFLSAESKAQSTGNQLVPLQLNKYQSSCDKKPICQIPKVLPKLGDYVVVQGEIKGFVNYIGPMKGEKSDFVGIHLNSPVGNNNGSLDGVRYFTCPANYGAFVSLQDVTQVIPKSSPKEVISVNNMPFQSKNEFNRSNCFERSTNNQLTQDQEERQSVEIAA